jgi:hypothetical protein
MDLIAKRWLPAADWQDLKHPAAGAPTALTPEMRDQVLREIRIRTGASVLHRDVPPSLFEWLNVATRKFGDKVMDRIRGEVTAHYRDAFDRHTENGLSECEAHAAAMAELGDAKRAARAFRRTNLTKNDMEAIRKLHVPEKGALISVFYLFMQAGFYDLTHASGFWFTGASFAACLLFYFVLTRLVPKLMAIRKFRRAVAWQFTIYLVLLFVMLSVFVPIIEAQMRRPLSPAWIWLVGLLAAALVLLLFRGVSTLWRKLSGPHVDDDFPAGGSYA